MVDLVLIKRLQPYHRKGISWISTADFEMLSTHNKKAQPKLSLKYSLMVS
jgi:hypothetical protein